MNKYNIDKTSQTLGTVFIAGMLASTFLPSYCKDEPFPRTIQSSASNNYAFALHGTSQTHESSKSSLTGYYLSSAKMFEAAITSFFEEISSNQEALGHEFEQVLFENLWDLYQS